MAVKKGMPSEYPLLLRAKHGVFKANNKELISLYWDIGKMITGRQRGKSWGKSVVENLARDLQTEFPGIQGFSPSNLWRMKVLYDIYSQNRKLAPMVREI